MASERLGGIHLALNARTRFFRGTLAESLSADLHAPTSPAILLRGSATWTDRDSGAEFHAGHVQVIGFKESLWEFGDTKLQIPSRQLAINERLAAKLGLKVGDDLVLRVDKPSLLSRDAPLSTISDASVTIRLPVGSILTGNQLGNFSLDANQIPPLNAFVPMEALQSRIGMEVRVNTLLVGGNANTATATSALWRHWELADSSLDLHDMIGHKVRSLRTERVFLEPAIGEAALKATSDAGGVLTYFVNDLQIGKRSTPYSTVAALDGSPIPPDMGDNETLINSWLAQDLKAKPGDEVKLTYYVVGAMRKLTEQTSTFRVRGILPLNPATADPDLMPPIPGLSDKKNCRDWEPGVPIDLKRIRDKDQEYWAAYRGTPKAYITLRAGQRIWNNRFGNLTSVRYPVGSISGGALDICIRQALSPGSLGLYFSPVRDLAQAAANQSMDFGLLFLSFSLFLIVAALLLTALLFGLGVEQRSEEVGILLAVGFTPKTVRRMLLLEGGVIASIAGVVGAIFALAYTRAVVAGLSSVWRGAVGASALRFHVEPITVLGGSVAALLVAIVSIWLVVRKQGQIPARILLSGSANAGTESPGREGALRSSRAGSRIPPSRIPLVVVLASGPFAIALVLTASRSGREQASEYFFGAGALLLISGIAACRILLARLGTVAASRALTIGSLGSRNASRRPGRTLSAIALLACGGFLVISVGASRRESQTDADKKSSGTGGFAFYAESTLPVFEDLNSPSGREKYGLDSPSLTTTSFLPMRLREGDEASCLNMNRAQSPRILGVRPDALSLRGAFTFSGLRDSSAKIDPWHILSKMEQDGAIPAIGDTNTVTWALGKSLGDVIPYVDESGNPIKFRILGVLANSILQGGLIISDENFTRLFPSQAGYQVFLIDSLGDNASVRTEISRSMSDVGVDLIPAAQRLDEFNVVENTYLAIFAALGGLGLLLGSGGLGVIVLRNALERRAELAILRAVGFRRGALHRLIFGEHALILALGLAVGIVAALVAIAPAMRSPGSGGGAGSLGITLALVLVNGLIWTWLATTIAIRGTLLNALRNE